MLYSLVLIVVMASTGGPIDVTWTVPGLPLAVCEIMKEQSGLDSEALQGKVYDAVAVCVPDEDDYEQEKKL